MEPGKLYQGLFKKLKIMGAESVYIKMYGNNMNEAFNAAVDEAKEYHGHNEGYSGAINCCSLVKDVTDKLKTMSRKELDEWIMDTVNKREVYGYCIKPPVANKNKVKSKIQSFPQKGTRKWKTVYEAHDIFGTVMLSADSQTDCIKKAREYVEKNKTRRVTISITKKLVQGTGLCATVEYKPSGNESKGEYVFVGLAPS